MDARLLPALYHRHRDGQIDDDSRIIAVGRGDVRREDYLGQVEAASRLNLSAGDFADAEWHDFSTRLRYIKADATGHDYWQDLVDELHGREERVRVAYLATAPGLFGPIAEGLRRNQLITPASRIVLEKPVGTDYESALKINEEVGACFNESQIFRIDHYLGKETVQNLLALRFGNSLFEPLWRRGTIDHVQITVAEELGVGNRASSMTASARCATWSRTTCCSSSA